MNYSTVYVGMDVHVNDILLGAAKEFCRFRRVDDSAGGKVPEGLHRQRNAFANSVEHRIRNGHVHVSLTYDKFANL